MVNIDTVYQTVQALANKEQRGYITPQEFNLFANQAQDDIFEQYLYDLEAFRERRPEQHQLGDSVTRIMEKISSWYSIQTVTGGTQLPPGDVGRIFVDGTGINPDRRTLRLIEPDEIRNIKNSKWHNEGFDSTVYFDTGYKTIEVWDNGTKLTSGVSCETVVGRPSLPYWGYVIVNEKPTYDPTQSQNFQIHRSEQTDLVVKILKLAGISIEDPQLYQAAQAEEQINIQQENK